eukprot:2905510-Pleurochrysis_carterae.AAC.1
MPFIEHLLLKHTLLVHNILVHFELYFIGDFAGVRAIENCICGCHPEAMHAVPAADAISTVAALKQTCAACDCRATTEQRIVRAHEPVDG